MACSNPWNSVFQVGSHHLAHQLLHMGYEVAFISDPISPLHLARGKELKKRLQLYAQPSSKQEPLWAYVPGALFTPHNAPLLRSRWLYKHWHQLTFPSLIKKARAHGFQEVDILYFDSPLQSFWLNTLSFRKSVFRVPDRNAGFQHIPPAFLQQEQELIQKVDVVLSSAKTLSEEIPGSIHFPNGVNLGHFSKPRKEPEEYKTIPRPIAVYVGAMEYWFDAALLKQLASAFPAVSFVLIGPMKKNPFQAFSNIYAFGPKEYASIPGYLQHAQVGIIPFDVKGYAKLIDAVNPLKLYEYMASSLPVVATRWKELEYLNSPAYLADSFEEFERALEKALAFPPQSVREYVEKQDWSFRAKELIELLR